MNTDRLRSPEDIGATGAAWVSELELDALVEIAKAARDMADADCDGYLAGAPFYGKLRSALARLDSGAAE